MTNMKISQYQIGRINVKRLDGYVQTIKQRLVSLEDQVTFKLTTLDPSKVIVGSSMTVNGIMYEEYDVIQNPLGSFIRTGSTFQWINTAANGVNNC